MKSDYRPDIDGLRAIAVLIVVAYHAGIPGFGGGFVGVDVFFVISGFLITNLLQNELASSGTLSFLSFYERRFRRLLPALLTMVSLTALIWLIFMPGLGDSRKMAASIRWSMLGAANLFFRRNTGGYFDGPTAEMPFLHLWSLGVEEQFYLCWPIILLMLESRLFKKFSGLRASIKVGCFILGLIPLSFLAAEFMIRHGRVSEAFYLMPYRAWELAVGAGLVFLPKIAPQFELKRIRPWVSLAGLCMIAGSASLYSKASLFPGLFAVVPVFGAALLIGSGTGKEAGTLSKWLSHPLLVKIGLLSYGWYLWHWPLLAMLRSWNLGVEPPMIFKLGTVLFGLALAELSLRWVENPIRKSKSIKRLTSAQILVIGVAVCSGVLICSIGFMRVERSVLGMRLGNELVRQVDERTPLGKDCFSKEDIGTERCNFSFASSPDTPTPTLAIWGDSHACSYFPMIEALARAHHYRATQYCAGDTPPLLDRPLDLGLIQKATSPTELAGFAQAVIWDLKRKKLAYPHQPISVVLAARWVAYPQIKEQLRQTLVELSLAGVDRVLVMDPYPSFKSTTFSCMLRTPGQCSVNRAEVVSARLKTMDAISTALSDLSWVKQLDPLKVVCNEEYCPQVLDTLPVVLDDNHPTLGAVQKIGAYFHDDLEWWANPGTQKLNLPGRTRTTTTE